MLGTVKIYEETKPHSYPLGETHFDIKSSILSFGDSHHPHSVSRWRYIAPTSEELAKGIGGKYIPLDDVAKAEALISKPVPPLPPPSLLPSRPSTVTQPPRTRGSAQYRSSTVTQPMRQPAQPETSIRTVVVESSSGSLSPAKPEVRDRPQVEPPVVFKARLSAEDVGLKRGSTPTSTETDVIEHRHVFAIPQHVEEQQTLVRDRTGASRLHEMGFYGQNVRIGMMDYAPDPHKFYAHSLETGLSFGTTGFHGTHIAGIIHNIAPNSKIVSFETFVSGATSQSIFSSCLTAVVNSDIDVLNISSGGDMILGSSETLYVYNGRVMNIDGIWEDLSRRGILVVLSSGNRGSLDENLFKQLASTYCLCPTDTDYHLGQSLKLPMRNKWPITVTSCDLDMKISGFNSVNKGVMCMSYGEKIESCVGTEEYVARSGTSMAAPQVTAILGLLLSYMKHTYPTMEKVTRAQIVRQYLLNCATYRDIPRMMSTLTLPPDFKAHSDEILGLLSQKRTSEAVAAIDRYMKCCGYKVVESNPQFSTLGGICERSERPGDCGRPRGHEPWGSRSDEAKIHAFQQMMSGLIRKYTTLSVGYGLVNVHAFKSIPSRIEAIPTKQPFEL